MSVEDSSMNIDKKESDSDSGVDITLDLSKMKLELLEKTKQCQDRGLTHSFKWLSEILYSIRYVRTYINNVFNRVTVNH